MRRKASSRLMLLVITVSTAWMRFSSSAVIASSRMSLNNRPSAPSAAPVKTQASGGQNTTALTTVPVAIRVAP